MPLALAIFLSLLPVLIVFAIVAWPELRRRLLARHWLKYVRSHPTAHRRVRK